jgi:sterol desaturase/sphingolipid hydroxylase (fatty acid hydroxylase superfamily)
MPVHFWTHMVLLFFTGVWTASIHDTIRGNSEPIMGSKYHTYHHTAYRDNYGQFFVFFDWIHGTLTDPLVLAAQKRAERAAAEGADADPSAAQQGGDGYGVVEDAGAQDPVGAALSERAAREAKKAS